MRLTAFGCIGAAALTFATAALAEESAFKIVDEIPVGGPGGWDYATFDDARKILYLSHATAVASVDVERKLANPHFADADGAHIALPLEGETLLLVTHGKANRVTLNDSKTGEVRESISTDAGPDAAVYDASSRRAFVMAGHGKAIDIIDVGEAKIVARIPVDGSPEGAATDGKGRIFTHLEDKNRLLVIDSVQHAVRASFSLEDCHEPSGLAYVPDRNWVLSACANGIARFTNAATGAKVATVTIGARPDAAIVDQKNGIAFVPCGDGTLAVIRLDGKTPRVTQILVTQKGARTGALDAATGTLYLPVGDLQAPAEGQRPAPIPDTLRVLVVGH